MMNKAPPVLRLSGFQENGLANVNISWETAQASWTWGSDVSLFDNQHTDNGGLTTMTVMPNCCRYEAKVSRLSGASYPPENIGVNLYQGGELTRYLPGPDE